MPSIFSSKSSHIPLVVILHDDFLILLFHGRFGRGGIVFIRGTEMGETNSRLSPQRKSAIVRLTEMLHSLDRPGLTCIRIG